MRRVRLWYGKWLTWWEIQFTFISTASTAIDRCTEQIQKAFDILHLHVTRGNCTVCITRNFWEKHTFLFRKRLEIAQFSSKQFRAQSIWQLTQLVKTAAFWFTTCTILLEHFSQISCCVLLLLFPPNMSLRHHSSWLRTFVPSFPQISSQLTQIQLDGDADSKLWYRSVFRATNLPRNAHVGFY